jgi:exosortase/archaeosortase family protein
MNLFRWFAGGIETTTHDYSPLVPPILAMYLLNRFNDSPHEKKHRGYGFFFGSFFFLMMAYSYHQVWTRYDTIHLIPFFVGYLGLAHALFLLFFSKKFIKRNQSLFKGFSLIMAAILAGFLALQYYWGAMASGISNILKEALSIFPLDIQSSVDWNIISLNDFSVIIGLPCTGLTSLLLFGSLYGLIGWYLRTKNKLNIPNYLIGLVLGFFTMIFFNLTRIAIILFIGAYYSPELALAAFHNIAGMLMFLAVAIIYIKFIMKWIILPHERSSQ